MKIALLGQFGSGNIGNDGSLKSMTEYLREYAPDADLLCICSRPEEIMATMGLAAVGITRSASLSQGRSLVVSKLSRLNRIRQNFEYAFRTAKDCDLIIVPGTGILDDFKELPFGWPFCLLRWTTAARLARTPVAFVSVGAGPINNWLSRRFLISAAKGTDYISYRDQNSLDYMSEYGSAYNNSVYPDIVFRQKSQETRRVKRNARERPCIGLGVMNYSGWSKSGANNQETYERYISEMTLLARLLTSEGSQVRLLTGGREDRTAVEEILDAAKRWQDEETSSLLEYNEINSLDDLRDEIAQTDIVVASRYHNVVCSLAMLKPTISLAYASKNDAIMRDFGLQDYSRSISNFAARDILGLIKMAHADGANIARRSAITMRDYRRRLSIQDLCIFNLFLIRTQRRLDTTFAHDSRDDLRCE
ncbi:polysaccharide pyruvyl transferase family protein (plasmid) [Salipiger sp. H15]|uniref:Polysaccharide pyruvyl transferase family protein n=1 Tax=Alloyangia sp. H15 TaxID=3029062 RepID=A0AAU8AT30_9RHOB